MQSEGQSIGPIVRQASTSFLFAILCLSVITLAVPVAAQVYPHPPSTTTVGGHFLAPAPSVTSVGGRHMPPPAPSVTSIPNYGYKPHGGGYHNGRYGYGYVGGWAYSIPYYYPVDNSAYGYDYIGAGGPDLSSGPPPGSYDPSLHIVVEQPPVNPYIGEAPPTEAQAQAQPAPMAKPLPDDQPGDPTVLVFRNGHHEQVNSYAIMGDSLYVFDEGRKKIALADIDIPATIKVNDNRGVEFRMPPSARKAAATTPSVTPKSDATPSNETVTPPNVAAVMP